MRDIIASFHMENQIRSQWGKRLIRQLNVWSDGSQVSRYDAAYLCNSILALLCYFQTDLLTLDSGNHKQKIREFETKIQVRRKYQKQLNFRELTQSCKFTIWVDKLN